MCRRQRLFIKSEYIHGLIKEKKNKNNTNTKQNKTKKRSKQRLPNTTSLRFYDAFALFWFDCTRFFQWL